MINFLLHFAGWIRRETHSLSDRDADEACLPRAVPQPTMFPHPFPVGVLCWMCRAPFYSLTIAQDVSDFLSALDEINGERDRRLSL